MLLNSHISAYATCFAPKDCGLVRSSLGGDKLGDRDRILNTKVARRACGGRAPGKHSPIRGGNFPPLAALSPHPLLASHPTVPAHKLCALVMGPHVRALGCPSAMRSP